MVSADRADVLSRYHARREGTLPSARAQLDLARWCEANGLAAEAQAHLTVVTNLEPGNAEARSRLGQRRVEGRWMTETAIAQLVEERKLQAEADRRYTPWLESWRDYLHEGGHRDEAVKALDAIKDPRAVPAVRAVFGRGDSNDQSWAVRMFSHIDSPEATLSIGGIALKGKALWIRKSAEDALVGRDARGLVGMIINRLRDPVRFEVRPGRGFDEVGELWVERPTEILDRVYDAPRPGVGASASSGEVGRLDSSGTTRRLNREVLPDLAGTLREERAAYSRAEARLEGDARRLEIDNFAISRGNERLLHILRRLTGHDLGEDREAWASWWTDQLGYSYRSPQRETPLKPVVVEHVAAPVVIAMTRTIDRPVASVHYSCFAAGTLVQCEGGPRPIEKLEVGDLVLSLNTANGSTSLRPVVASFHNPPSETLRVEFGEDFVVATGIHRFWRVGIGWTMARDLRVGDVLRLARGEAFVTSVSRSDFQPVHNLAVLGDSDFFVGRAGALVHDNSIVRPTGKAFDAPASR